MHRDTEKEEREIQDETFALSLRPTHGSARVTFVPSLLSDDKENIECFWVKALVEHTSNLSSQVATIRPSVDDSDGKDDVVIGLKGGGTIGVQVTRLTSSLQIRRSANRTKLLTEVVDTLKKKNITSSYKVLLNVSIPEASNATQKLPKSGKIVDAIIKALSCDSRVTKFDGLNVIQDKLEENQKFYVPSVNNIGVEIGCDNIPVSESTYKDSVTLLADKKSNTKSQWLLIWSFDYWAFRDYKWGKDLIELMKEKFSNSPAENVIFIESLDCGDKIFSANLKVHKIK